MTLMFEFHHHGDNGAIKLMDEFTSEDLAEEMRQVILIDAIVELFAIICLRYPWVDPENITDRLGPEVARRVLELHLEPGRH